MLLLWVQSIKLKMQSAVKKAPVDRSCHKCPLHFTLNVKWCNALLLESFAHEKKGRKVLYPFFWKDLTKLNLLFMGFCCWPCMRCEMSVHQKDYEYQMEKDVISPESGQFVRNAPGYRGQSTGIIATLAVFLHLTFNCPWISSKVDAKKMIAALNLFIILSSGEIIISRRPFNKLCFMIF